MNSFQLELLDVLQLKNAEKELFNWKSLISLQGLLVLIARLPWHTIEGALVSSLQYALHVVYVPHGPVNEIRLSKSEGMTVNHSSSHLVSASFGLIVKHLCTSFTCLLLVNVFHQDALVLEDITLDLHVEIVVQVTIDLLGFAVFLQQATKDTHTSHPEEFHWSTSVRCSLALTISTMTTLSASECRFTDAETRVHDDWLFDDQTVFDQFADVLSC